LDECDLDKSIKKNIVLIITSKFNEHRYDPKYGCEVWDSDFELISDSTSWKEQIRKSVTESLLKFEKRLTEVDVSTELNEEELKIWRKNIVTVKKKLEIRINYRIKKTGEYAKFKMNLYIGPLSQD
jgi:phage baseplate assembly protein W